MLNWKQSCAKLTDWSGDFMWMLTVSTSLSWWRVRGFNRHITTPLAQHALRKVKLMMGCEPAHPSTKILICVHAHRLWKMLGYRRQLETYIPSLYVPSLKLHSRHAKGEVSQCVHQTTIGKKCFLQRTPCSCTFQECSNWTPEIRSTIWDYRYTCAINTICS